MLIKLNIYIFFSKQGADWHQTKFSTNTYLKIDWNWMIQHKLQVHVTDNVGIIFLFIY